MSNRMSVKDRILKWLFLTFLSDGLFRYHEQYFMPLVQRVHKLELRRASDEEYIRRNPMYYPNGSRVPEASLPPMNEPGYREEESGDSLSFEDEKMCEEYHREMERQSHEVGTGDLEA